MPPCPQGQQLEKHGNVVVADCSARDGKSGNARQILGKDWVLRASLRPSAPALLPADPPSGSVGIERALSEALNLIDTALSEHRKVGGERAVSELSDNDEAGALAVKQLVYGARRELVCVTTPERLMHGPLHPAGEALRTPPGVTAPMRVLFPVRGSEDRHRIRMLLRGNTPTDCRITQAHLQEMLLADRRTGLLITQFEPDRYQTLVIRSLAIVKTLHALFAQSWESAAPLLPVSLLDDPRQRDTTRQILASLSEGQKDDVAARELGISVRTYRKYVADFMRDINATSRFQAGMRAAQLQLLPAE
jgi:hypothetical protein